ncbi:MAG TPA: CusA/CzcA family heavy metal efflux RND transporter [Kofleriaceae bacterium]|nr:CusA/CzcA family heavy metal efflux RND transporter [Kofleriaceae bacterium]
MIDRLLQASLHRRLGVLALAVTLGILGYYAFSHLTIEAFPDPTDTQVQVITLYPGQPAEEVERRISIPIERALNGVPGTMRQRSISLFGLSLVTLTFDDDVDTQVARQQIMERIPDANLPPNITPDLGPLATPIGEVYRYTLEGKTSDPMTLRTLQDWVVAPALQRVPGVADVVSYGGLVKEIHVEPNPAKMSALGVVLDDLFGALSKASANASGGLVTRGAQGFVIRSVGTFASTDEILDVRVGFHAGVPVTMRDVAHVVIGYAPRQGVVTRNDNLDAVQGIVLMRKGQNPSVVLEGIRARVAELQQHSLPDGARIDPFYDRTELVDTTLETVFHNLLEGAILVTLVLFVFLLSIRASLVVVAVIPLSLAAAFIYLHVRGMSANLLSMGAVDFGIIVDGAVILVEHVFEHAAGEAYQRKSGAERIRTIFDAARQVGRPTLFSLLIIVAAYLPIFALQRVEGRIFAPMAHTVVSALVGAMVVSFTLVPVLCFFALRRHKAVRVSPVLSAARRFHDPILSAAMHNPLAVLAVAIGLVAGGVVLAPRLGSEFLPELNEGSIYVTFTLPPTASLDDGRALTPKILERLRAGVPEVTEVLSQLGRPEDGTDAKLFNNLEVFIKLRPMAEWRPGLHTLDDIVAIMTRNLGSIPGIEYNFSQPIRDNVNENISGQQGQVAVKIYGDDVAQLRKLADAAEAEIAKVPGIADPGIVKASEAPVIAVVPNRKALARWDQDLGSLQSYLETALSGHTASELWEGEKRFDVTVRFPKASREDLATIRDLLVPLKDGALIPVSALAKVDMANGPSAITRENGKRYIGIRANVRNRDLGSVIADARRRVDASVALPVGYDMTWGGEFENQERAMKRLALVLPLSLVLTFILLFSAFGSVWDASIILLNLPIALLGGLGGLAAAEMTLSVSAAVGFIALLGQAVLNCVLVVSAIRSRRERGEDLWTATLEGTRERLRAILMTALLASLGLLPAALSHAIGSETQRPIAVVVVCGTISAALLTLLVLPVSYYWAHTLRARLQRRWGGTTGDAAGEII